MSDAERAVRMLPRADLALALLVVAILALMIVPLPTVLIDLLIALNLGFGILLLAAALYLRDTLRFAAFPTLLLLSTLYRLALNVASTRLILLQADAGRVIEAFGSFVVRGDYRVGGLVFAMLTLIQLLVIARGAERVAEVSARFSLDALPGKQLAIDAELRSGALRPEQARARRRTLERESQLYGALDGALKFVKGDAIAGIVITLINFLGGVSIGVFGRELELPEALKTYGLLTIGDGLVTQLPALLSATAAGLVVTRVAPEGGSLANAIGDTLLGEPRALALGAAVLLGLALVPGLPGWPFCAVAGIALVGFVRQTRRAAPARAEDLSRVLVLELGSTLAAQWLRPDARRELTSALERVRQRSQQQLGLLLPALDLHASDALPPLSLRWVLRELPARVVGVSESTGALASAEQELAQLLRTRASELLELDQVQAMVDRLEREQPALVHSAVPKPLSVPQLTGVLRLLLAEGVSVRWLSEIVEAIAPAAGEHADVHTLAELARGALARRISHAVAPNGVLHVMRVSPELEEALSDGLRGAGREQIVALPADLARDIVDAVSTAHRRAPLPHALITTRDLRRHVRALLSEHAPDLPVLTAEELMPHLSLSTGELIGP